MELNTIQQADAVDWLRSLTESSVDMTITSPPYDNLRDYVGYNLDFENTAHELYRVLKPGGVLVWVVGDSVINGSESLTSFRQAIHFVEAVGFRLHDTMIYHKDGAPFPESNRYLQTFEYMFVLSKGTPKTANLIQTKTLYGGSHTNSTRQKDGKTKRFNYAVNKQMRTMDNVWNIQCGYMKTTKDIEAYRHPAMYPEALAERHILTWSSTGDIVCDPFMGSGTTALVARRNNRQYIGCDINADYVDLANRRLAKPYTPIILNW